jgi:hypothetical protein
MWKLVRIVACRFLAALFRRDPLTGAELAIHVGTARRVSEV